MGNSRKEIEHPKPLIEVMTNTREAIAGYAAATGMTFLEAALVLLLNEERCIHWHHDNALALKVDNTSSHG